MKIPINKLAILCTAVCAAMLAFTHNASADYNATIGDGKTLGYVLYGIPSGNQDRENYVNHFVYMYNNGIASDPSFLEQSYQILSGSPAFAASFLIPVLAFIVMPTDK